MITFLLLIMLLLPYLPLIHSQVEQINIGVTHFREETKHFRFRHNEEDEVRIEKIKFEKTFVEIIGSRGSMTMPSVFVVLGENASCDLKENALKGKIDDRNGHDGESKPYKFRTLIRDSFLARPEQVHLFRNELTFCGRDKEIAKISAQLSPEHEYILLAGSTPVNVMQENLGQFSEIHILQGQNAIWVKEHVPQSGQNRLSISHPEVFKVSSLKIGKLIEKPNRASITVIGNFLMTGQFQLFALAGLNARLDCEKTAFQIEISLARGNFVSSEQTMTFQTFVFFQDKIEGYKTFRKGIKICVRHLQEGWTKMVSILRPQFEIGRQYFLQGDEIYNKNILKIKREKLECFADYIYGMYNDANAPTMVVANLEKQKWITRRAFARQNFNENQMINEKNMFHNDYEEDHEGVKEIWAKECFDSISALLEWNQKSGNRSINVKSLFEASDDGLLTLSEKFRQELDEQMFCLANFLEENYDGVILEFHPSNAPIAVENADQAILNSYRLREPYQDKIMRMTMKRNLAAEQFTFKSGNEKFDQLNECRVKKYKDSKIPTSLNVLELLSKYKPDQIFFKTMPKRFRNDSEPEEEEKEEPQYEYEYKQRWSGAGHSGGAGGSNENYHNHNKYSRERSREQEHRQNIRRPVPANVDVKEEDINNFLKMGENGTLAGAELRTAYRVLALKYHPDKNKENKEKEAWAEERFKIIQNAFERFSGTGKRFAPE